MCNIEVRAIWLLKEEIEISKTIVSKLAKRMKVWLLSAAW